MKKKRAFGYKRRSPRSEKDFGNTSLEKQEDEIIKYCEMNDIELVDVYVDDLKSGSSFKGRDGFIEMYNRVVKEEEDIDYIIVYKQDRLSRDPLDTLYFMKQLNAIDKHIICIADSINTEDPTAKILVHVLSLVAELEREFISFRTNSGMEKKAEDGDFLGGKIYGYEVINKKLSILPDEAKIVKYIFDKYVSENWGYKKIAGNLNIQGVKTKHKKEWTTTAIKTILQNQIYIGNIKWRGKYTKGQHTRIIEQTLWDQVKFVMQARSFIPQKKNPGSYPLSGLLRCPQCKGIMVQGNSNPQNKYYQCNKNKCSGSSVCKSNLVKKEYAEEYVLQDFLHRLKNKVSASVVYSVIKSILNYELNPLENEASNLKKQIEKLEREMLKIMEHSSDPLLNLDREMIRTQLVRKQNEIIKIKTIHADITMQIELKQNDSIMDIIEFSIKNFEDFYHTLSDDEKKLFFHSVIKEVHVTEEEKPKDRRIKEVIYHFDLEELNRIVKS
ncbi:site-specific DNA recombinase [Bacillus mesophilus]|uniref:Recombinase family protein n=1 Tax=Bacillus mesophilus TaxID=1808955 RepID=A0A6M0Q9P5_9BACI|nr:recombinase family protein [Bacillus mesophilus]MBM7662269.1 site-specific DNA recombinase [Bacillus mesophilus]NEY73096.1 recombinase family protein [Bacillus mesophilus]